MDDTKNQWWKLQSSDKSKEELETSGIESSGAAESKTTKSQKATLASEAGGVSQLESSKTSPTASQRNKEQLKQVQPEQVTQEQVTQVLLSWLETYKKASNKDNKAPLKQDYQSAINKIDEVVQDIIKFPKLQEFTNFPKVLTDRRNKYSFAEAVENMVKKVLASQISDSEELSKFQSTYGFYFVNRQELLKAAKEIYPDYQIGTIWA